MAKYFLGSVGTAEAFRMINGEPVLAFVSKTLTDSGINISTTKDDVRAGTGAPIQFSFYHDPSVEINLTDVLFDETYVEAQLGTKFNQGADIYKSATFEATDGHMTYTIEDELASLNMGCGNSKKVVWYSLNNGEWKVADTELEGSVFTAPEAGTVCLRYVTHDENARMAEITSDMIPEELFLVITAPIYAGDACSASNGKAAGYITYEIPRFKLNGAQEFTMNMSSNQTMSLSGVALASQDGCNVNGSTLLRIKTFYEDQHWYDNLTELIADEDYLKVGDEPHIYGLYKNGSISLVDNGELTFAPALTTGKWTSAGSTTVTVTEKTSITDTVTIASA